MDSPVRLSVIVTLSATSVLPACLSWLRSFGSAGGRADARGRCPSAAAAMDEPSGVRAGHANVLGSRHARGTSRRAVSRHGRCDADTSRTARARWTKSRRSGTASPTERGRRPRRARPGASSRRAATGAALAGRTAAPNPWKASVASRRMPSTSACGARSTPARRRARCRGRRGTRCPTGLAAAAGAGESSVRSTASKSAERVILRGDQDVVLVEQRSGSPRRDRRRGGSRRPGRAARSWSWGTSEVVVASTMTR